MNTKYRVLIIASHDFLHYQRGDVIRSVKSLIAAKNFAKNFVKKFGYESFLSFKE